MGSEKVQIRGLRELSTAFKRVDVEIAKQLRVEFGEIARNIVGIARPRVPVRTGRAASSIKPRSAQRGAGVALGGARAEYMPWLEFGGSVGRGHIPRAGGGAIKRPYLGHDGQYVVQAVKDERDETQAAAFAAVEHAARSAGFDWNDL